jgi:hypothetical protein
MKLPEVLSNNNWTAIVSIDGVIHLTCGIPNADYGCSAENSLPTLLSPLSARYAPPKSKILMDLNLGEVRFPILVTSTLGVSASTYAWLALIGVALSGALGNGWLFKLLEYVKARKTPEH